MLDLSNQTKFADATAAMMRACAIAATNAMAQSARQGLSFWSDMMCLGAPARPVSPGVSPAALSPDYWTAFVVGPWTPARSVQTAARPAGAPTPAAQPATDSGYASYRSAGGHASAQVVVAPEA